MQLFIPQGTVKAFEKIIGVHDQVAVYKAMLPSYRPISILPFRVDTGRHIPEQCSEVQTQSVGLPTEPTPIDPTASAHKNPQGLITDTLLAHIIKVAISTEPVNGLFFPKPLRQPHQLMLPKGANTSMPEPTHAPVRIR